MVPATGKHINPAIHKQKKELPIVDSSLSYARCIINAVFFCFISSGTEEMKISFPHP